MNRPRRIATAVALSAALYAAAVCLAPVATLAVMLVPLPALILATRAPFAECVAWLGLTSALLAGGLGVPTALGFALPLGAPTVVLAFALGRFWSLERTVVSGVLVWSLAIAGVSLLAFGGNVETLIATVREQLQHSFDLALATTGSFGAPDTTVAAVAAERDVVIEALLELMPGLIVLAGGVLVLANLMVVRGWTGIARNVNLRLWRTPDALIWALIIAGFGVFLPLEPVALVARNVFVVLLGCYFCQGLAIVSYYLDRFRLPRGIQVAGYVLIAVQHVVAALVLALGVFDLWGNFRRLGAGPADVRFDTDGD